MRMRKKHQGGIHPVVLDLFCGAGGMSLGFEMAGCQIGLGVDSDPIACQTHSHNFGNRCIQADVNSIRDPQAFVADHGLRQVDVIIGGPPCQGFSRVGRGKLRSLRNDSSYIHDPRNQYYKEFIRFVQELRPFYLVMENVPDLQYYADGGRLLIDKVRSRLGKLGYNIEAMVLQADHYGVPQTRKRLFLVGNSLGISIRPPKKTSVAGPITVWQAISDLPIVPHGHRQDEMQYEARHELNRYQKMMRERAGDKLYNHQTRWHNAQDLEAFAWLPEGGKYVDLPAQYKRYRDDIFRDKYWKLYRDFPSWTIEAHIGKDTYRHIFPSCDGEPEPPRTISVREAARLQSFPDRFRFMGPFTNQFRQVGNAVPPLLAKAVARSIFPGVLQGVKARRRPLLEEGDACR